MYKDDTSDDCLPDPHKQRFLILLYRYTTTHLVYRYILSYNLIYRIFPWMQPPTGGPQPDGKFAKAVSCSDQRLAAPAAMSEIDDPPSGGSSYLPLMHPRQRMLREGNFAQANSPMRSGTCCGCSKLRLMTRHPPCHLILSPVISSRRFSWLPSRILHLTPISLPARFPSFSKGMEMRGRSHRPPRIRYGNPPGASVISLTFRRGSSAAA